MYDTCSDALKREVIKQVLENFKSGISYESCCWAADVPPEVFNRWRLNSTLLNKACMREMALLEKECVRIKNGQPDKDGNRPTAMDQRMAFETLKLTNRAWMPKQTGAALAAGLEELQKLLPADTYSTVVSTLHKHIDA